MGPVYLDSPHYRSRPRLPAGSKGLIDSKFIYLTNNKPSRRCAPMFSAGMVLWHQTVSRRLSCHFAATAPLPKQSIFLVMISFGHQLCRTCRCLKQHAFTSFICCRSFVTVRLTVTTGFDHVALGVRRCLVTPQNLHPPSLNVMRKADSSLCFCFSLCKIFRRLLLHWGTQTGFQGYICILRLLNSFYVLLVCWCSRLPLYLYSFRCTCL